MASRADDSVPEEQNLSQQAHENEQTSMTSSDNWGEFISYSDLKEAYDTVIEVYESSPHLPEDEIEGLNDEALLPSRESYDSTGESLEKLAEKLEGDTLIVALGFRGEDLPSYLELQDRSMNADGNWWDNPEELDADYLLDRETYAGAVDVPGFDTRHVMSEGNLNREVYLINEG